MPYLKPRGPPAHSATLPPIDDDSQTGRIRRIEEAYRFDGTLQVGGDHARLPRPPAGSSRRSKESCSAAPSKDDSPASRNGASRVAGPRAAHDQRYAPLVAEARDRRDLRSAAWDDDEVWRVADAEGVCAVPARATPRRCGRTPRRPRRSAHEQMSHGVSVLEPRRTRRHEGHEAARTVPS